jgi:hypothetical protein
VNLLGDNIDTIKKNRETLIDAIKEAGQEINIEKTADAIASPECRSKQGQVYASDLFTDWSSECLIAVWQTCEL